MPPSKFDKMVVYNILEYDPLLDSCNMTHLDWRRIAMDIVHYYDHYDGFVVLHGTDTMSYTGSALSFLLENLGKTVVITGSQIPIAVPLSDGISNLLGALTVAAHYEIPEVILFFCGKGMRANRCTKIDSASLDAFDCPNMEKLVEIGVDYKVKWNLLIPPPMGHVKLHSQFDSNIAVFRLFPGFSVSTLANILQPPLRGLVLSTFGAGNALDNNVNLITTLEEACARGVVIVNCTQCIAGTVEPHYATGQILSRAGVVPVLGKEKRHC
jgi:lysophospholipase